MKMSLIFKALFSEMVHHKKCVECYLQIKAFPTQDWWPSVPVVPGASDDVIKVFLGQVLIAAGVMKLKAWKEQCCYFNENLQNECCISLLDQHRT